MSGNWWINKSGKNALLTLPEWLVLEMLWRHPGARGAYASALELIEDQDEKDRVSSLVDSNQYVFKRPMRDPQDVADNLQSRQNRAGVRTRMPRKRKR